MLVNMVKYTPETFYRNPQFLLLIYDNEYETEENKNWIKN